MSRSPRVPLFSLCAALAVVAGAASCHDFRTAYGECVGNGGCVEEDAGGGDHSDASTDAGPSDAGADAGVDAGPVECLDAGTVEPGLPCHCSSDCANGLYCTDGVCCSEQNCGTCRACNLVGGGECANRLPGTERDSNECIAGPCTQDTCNGNGSCGTNEGKQCGTQTCSGGTVSVSHCSSGQCINDQNDSCLNGAPCDDAGVNCSNAECNPSDDMGCDAGTVCVNFQCVPGLRKGENCYMSAQSCKPGLSCVDFVCCTAAAADCTGPCNSCNTVDNRGDCVAIPSGGSPRPMTSCSGNPQCMPGTCNGGGACEVNQGQSCGSGQTCSNQTLTQYQCDSTGACSPSTSTCDPANNDFCVGNACVHKNSNGDSCQSDTECASNNCVGGTCCGTTFCTGGPCETCDPGSGYSSCMPSVCPPDGGSTLDGGDEDAGSPCTPGPLDGGSDGGKMGGCIGGP